MRIHVCVLNQGWVRVELAGLMMQLIASYRKHPLSLEFSGLGIERRPIASNRNRIVRDCPTDTDILVMIDSDCLPPLDFLDVADLMEERGLDLVGLPMPLWRNGDLRTGILLLENEGRELPVGSDEVVECAGIPGGVMFFHSRVFRHPELRGAFADAFDEDGVMANTEDYVYSERARALGFRAWAALAYPLAHFKEVNLQDVFDARVRKAVGDGV